MQRIKVVWRARRGTFVVRYLDPSTVSWKERSARSANKRDAERLAGKIAAELDAGIEPETIRKRSAADTPTSSLTWAQFVTRYEEEKLSQLRPKTRKQFAIANGHFKTFLESAFDADTDRILLGRVSSSILSQFHAHLRDTVDTDSSIASYLRTLKAALGWAQRIGLIEQKPTIDLPRHGRKSRHMRGRPLSAKEIKRIIAVAKKRRKHDAGQWERYLTGLHLSGLRLQESQLLSWHRSDPISLDVSGTYPQMRIHGEAEKGGKDRLLPLTPDFAEWALKTPEGARAGLVFGIVTNGRPMSPARLSRLISEFGRKANVIVDAAAERFATCHDFRRTFGNRWATKVTPAVLQQLMRHESIETTMKYYVEIDAENLADALYGSS